MAKIIFYLHADNNQPQRIIRAAGDLANHTLFDRFGFWLSVMTPRSSDLLAVPAESNFLDGLAAVVEIVVPYGQTLADIRSELHDAMAPVLDTANTGRSHVAAGYHRVFQESGAKPLRYHYLMYRLPHFTRADYLDYYVHSHSRFGVATPLADYYQNYLDQEASRELAKQFGVNPVEADSISELRFESVEAYLFSDIVRQIGPAASDDEKLFVNRPLCQSFSMDVLLDTRTYH